TQLVDLDAGAACTAKSRFSFGCAHDLALLLLGFFTKHVFIGVANAFAFVRLWRTEGANFRCHFTYRLFVRATDNNLGLGRRVNGDTLWQFEIDRMRKAEGQVQRLARSFRTVTDADQLQLALETFGDTNHEVVHQRARRTSLRPGTFDGCVARSERDLTVLHLHV